MNNVSLKGKSIYNSAKYTELMKEPKDFEQEYTHTHTKWEIEMKNDEIL